MTTSVPYLSVIGWVRNDGYTDGYAERIRHAIRFLAGQLDSHGIPSEIVVVEWNPPADRPLVADLLSDLTNAGCVTIRFIVVDRRYHEHLLGSQLKGMHVLNAANAGLRRARGRFLVPKALDTYFTDELIAHIARQQLLDEEVYRCDRYDVRFETEDWLKWDRAELFKRMSANIVEHHVRIQQSPYWGVRDLHTNACGDFTLMAARHWHEIRGFQDDPTVLCLDADSIALHAAAAHGVREVCWPGDCRIYKIVHENTFAHRVSQDWSGWQKRLERFVIGHLSTGLAVKLRIWFDYPRRRIRGIDGVVGPSIERNFVVKAQRYAMNDTSLVTNTEDWGLAREPLVERTVARASWDTPQEA